MVRWLLALVAVCAGPALAQQMCTQYRYNYYSATAWADSREEACMLHDGMVFQGAPITAIGYEVNNGCHVRHNGTDRWISDGFVQQQQAPCAPTCTAGEVVASGFFDIGTDATKAPVLMACKGECEAVFDGVSPAGSTLVEGVKHFYAKGSYVNTGNSCSSSDNDPGDGIPGDNPPPDTCPAGYDMGTVNGKHYCAPRSSDPPASAPTAPDGSPVDPYGTPLPQPETTTTRTGPVVTNPDGSTSQTTTTTNPDGSTTQTTTTTNPDGSTETTTTTTPSPDAGQDELPEEEDEEKPPCDEDPTSDACTGTTAEIGALYTAKDKTFAGVLEARKNEFLASPLGVAAGGFFVVPSGGSCPTWTLDIPYFSRSYQLDMFCTTSAAAILAALKACLLVAAAFFSFRVAVE